MKLNGLCKSPLVLLEVLALFAVRCNSVHSSSLSTDAPVAHHKLRPSALRVHSDVDVPDVAHVDGHTLFEHKRRVVRDNASNGTRSNSSEFNKGGSKRKPNGSAEESSMERAEQSQAAVLAKVDMTKIVAVYLGLVGLLVSYFTGVIVYGRLRPCKRGNACRRTDAQVHLMEEMRKERKTNRSRDSHVSSPDKSGDECQGATADEQARSTLTPRSRSGNMSGSIRTPRSEFEWDEFCDATGRGDYFSIETDVLVDVMGLSGMSLLEMDAVSGISGLTLIYALPACAIQAWFLQLVLLYYMARRVTRLTGDGGLEEGPKDVSFSIIFAAIYLHFINCMNDLPFSFSILRHIGELHDRWHHLAVALPAFLVDGLIIPFTSLIVGGFYLCTSATVSDVILNSCAVAFISNIDNWILQLSEKLNKAGSFDEGDDEVDEGEDGHTPREPTKTASGMRVFIPVNHKLMKNMSWAMCVLPIIPSIFSGAIGYIGLKVMHL